MTDVLRNVKKNMKQMWCIKKKRKRVGHMNIASRVRESMLIFSGPRKSWRPFKDSSGEFSKGEITNVG